MKIQDLAIKHDYYCSEQNYYSREAQSIFKTWGEHNAIYTATDVDLNLCFRWDVNAYDECDGETGYYMQLFIMHQRKGRFWPITIEHVYDEDVPSIMLYLQRNWAKMQRLWCPLSIPDLSAVANPVGAAQGIGGAAEDGSASSQTEPPQSPVAS